MDGEQDDLSHLTDLSDLNPADLFGPMDGNVDPGGSSGNIEKSDDQTKKHFDILTGEEEEYCKGFIPKNRAGTKVGKQPSKLRQQKGTKVRRFARVFINVGLTLIGYRKLPKQDYCFITRTSVVPVSVSIQIRHRWTEK